MSPDFKATHYKIWDLRINLSRSSDVAWYSCMLEDCAEIKGEPGCWKDTRWTGVLEKREGKWVIVQMHFSFAADKVLADQETKNKFGMQLFFKSKTEPFNEEKSNEKVELIFSC
jgi:hypothetical protein